MIAEAGLMLTTMRRHRHPRGVRGCRMQGRAQRGRTGSIVARSVPRPGSLQGEPWRWIGLLRVSLPGVGQPRVSLLRAALTGGGLKQAGLLWVNPFRSTMPAAWGRCVSGRGKR